MRCNIHACQWGADVATADKETLGCATSRTGKRNLPPTERYRPDQQRRNDRQNIENLDRQTGASRYRTGDRSSFDWQSNGNLDRQTGACRSHIGARSSFDRKNNEMRIGRLALIVFSLVLAVARLVSLGIYILSRFALCVS